MEQKTKWLERPIHSSFPAITNEIVLFAFVMLLAIVTRFYDLESRVMSHDESLHTYFSWLLYRGQGYEHSPMMHGPFQFHALALVYFLFGVSDFTARIPAVLFSIATVGMVWYWRRYLGNWGAVIAGFLMVISPYMLYYGRYVRNESFVGFSGIVMLYAILRHLEVGGKKYLYILAATLALHFTSKETSFIYTAQALLFLAIYFFIQVSKKERWFQLEGNYSPFIISLCAAILLVGAAATTYLITHQETTLTGAETAMPANPEEGLAPFTSGDPATSPFLIIFGVAALLALVACAYYLIRGYSWEKLRNERSFDLLFVVGTIVLPQLAPFLINLTDVTMPTEVGQVQAIANDMRSILVIGGMLLLTFAISIVAGLLWNPEKFWKTALIFWVPFTILYTTIFTNSSGFFTGAIGSLGYWIVQQDVQRGSQPWYYYLLIQIPIYEFLPALGLFLALYLGFRRKTKVAPENQTEEDVKLLSISQTEEFNFKNTFALLVWWSFISFVAFTYAGERMPWLTYHIAWPMILITGWALGRLIDTTNWQAVKENNAALTFFSVAIFITSTARAFYIWNSPIRPFQGQGLEQLQATNQFLLPLIATILSAAAIVYFLRKWTFSDFRRVFVLIFFSFLAILTVRASFRAAYITYDQATEFLVYAHGATGIKEVIAQAEEISKRTTGGMNLALAYDASAPDTGVSWPMVWYLRDFTNTRSFDQPTRSLRESVFVIVDEKNFDKIDPALGPGYYRFDYIRMWWPMQDYFSLVYDRDASMPFPENYACKGALSFLKLRRSKDYSAFCEWFTNPEVRAGIIQIWLNRDYSQYASAKGRSDLTLATWVPSDRMRLYIRQDIASQIWNYGLAPSNSAALVQDPTEGKYVLLSADVVFDAFQINPVILNAPRSLAFAKDGTLYVADSRNHRVLHLDQDGSILHEWGTYADGVSIPIGDGTFNEPWGIAIGPDGSVYVTDTWNHRVQKFTRDGRFVKAWGGFGQGESPESFYGPRGLAVDSKGRVYVTDTGNKRIVVFDANGNFITQFGGAGFDPGLFDEPVGIAIDKNDTVYVNDTWNQRVQTFVPVENEDVLVFLPDKQWDVFGWLGQSLDNKPFIAVNDDLHVFITDPEGYRVMEFDQNGEIVRVWGDYGESYTSFGLASGITVDPQGHVWVTDGAFNRIMRFTLP